MNNFIVIGSICNIKIILKMKMFGKEKFFEKLKNVWCILICRRGDLFWFELVEFFREMFRSKFEDFR